MRPAIAGRFYLLHVWIFCPWPIGWGFLFHDFTGSICFEDEC
jgi:hypothetical protein